MSITAEEAREWKENLAAVLKTFTARQIEVLKLLQNGKPVTEVGGILGVTKQSVSDVRKAIQKSLKDFYKRCLTNRPFTVRIIEF
ncbi:MAG: LuxR C-terminal-related transcriptional regulator [Clostridiales bacterium]|nr:LuxR C-terminal-related transcriptional regulator [Clostridiales bacterium]